MGQETAIIGCLLGTAIGDALGLPCEGLPRRRLQRMFPDVSRYHFLFGRGMVSDDTEHTCMVAQALIASGGDMAAFRRHLAGQFRLWLLGLPAGIGLATLKATLKLWLGFNSEHSGVFSAGNGPAMRSALLGVCCPDERKKLRAWVRASTRITHTDLKPRLERSPLHWPLPWPAFLAPSRHRNIWPFCKMNWDRLPRNS